MGCCGQSGKSTDTGRVVRQIDPSTETFAIVGNVTGELVLPSGKVHKNVVPGVIIMVDKSDLADSRIVEYEQKAFSVFKSLKLGDV